MKIVICASIQFTPQIKEVAELLSSLGHEVTIPDGAERILKNEFSMSEFMQKKKQGEGYKSKMKHDVIRYYFKRIQECDVILVLNLTKNKIKNYIGGNTFLEMGFAHVLDKKIFVYNPLPDMHCIDEMITFEPVVINGNLKKIK